MGTQFLKNSNFSDQYDVNFSRRNNSKKDYGDTSSIVVVGASHAGISFVDKVRKNGFRGSLTLIDRQKGGPMQRPPLSKGFLLETSEKPNSKYLLKTSKWYKDEKVFLHTNVTVSKIDLRKKSLTFNNGKNLDYDKLVLATGAAPRMLPAAQGIPNVFVLRQPDQAMAIRKIAHSARNAIIIGGGYIGLEIAATFRQIGLEVSVVEVADRLLARVASPPVAELLAGLHQERGVVLYTGNGVEEVFQNNGLFSGVKLTDGKNLIGDILVVGIGVTPDSDLALRAGIETETTTGGAVLVDEYQLTSDPDVFAIGDVAFQRGSPLRLESIHNAQESGVRAAAAIMGKPLPAVQAPWFWSDQYDANLQSVGIVPMGDRNVYQVIRGEFPEKRASFWSYRDNKLLAVEAVRDGESFMLGKKCLEENISPDPSLISDLGFDPMAWILKNSARAE